MSAPSLFSASAASPEAQVGPSCSVAYDAQRIKRSGATTDGAPLRRGVSGLSEWKGPPLLGSASKCQD